MGNSTIMTYAIMGIITIVGILSIILNKPLFMGFTSRYTQESIDKFCRTGGVLSTLMGLTGMGFLYFMHQFFDNNKFGTLTLVLVGALLVEFVVYIVLCRKRLVKL